MDDGRACSACQHMPHPLRRCVGFANCGCDLRPSTALAPDEATGRELADAGMTVALENAHPAWRVLARATLLELAKQTYRTGGSFSAESITAIVGMPTALSGTHNGVGGLFGWASRKKLITLVGYVASERPDRHSNREGLWRGTESALTHEAEVAIPNTPVGQLSVFEAAWHCGSCDREVAAATVTVHAIAPNFGEAFCPKCLKKRQFQWR
jgi:predicted RNA-binding Zn-ribbon protein involved in translation (DUF1610 family)